MTLSCRKKQTESCLMCTHVRNPKWNESSSAIKFYSAEFWRAYCQDFLTMDRGDQTVSWWRICRGSVQHPESSCSSGMDFDNTEWFLSRSVHIDVHARRWFKFGLHQLPLTSRDTFLEIMQMVEASTKGERGHVWKQFQYAPSRCQEGECVCHGRAVGLHAHYVLVLPVDKLYPCQGGFRLTSSATYTSENLSLFWSWISLMAISCSFRSIAAFINTTGAFIEKSETFTEFQVSVEKDQGEERIYRLCFKGGWHSGYVLFWMSCDRVRRRAVPIHRCIDTIVEICELLHKSPKHFTAKRVLDILLVCSTFTWYLKVAVSRWNIKMVYLFVVRPWTTYVVQATLFAGLKVVAVRCSFTKSGFATGRQSQLINTAVSVQISGNFHGFISWVVHTSKMRRRKQVKCTEMQCVSNHAESSLSVWFTYVAQNRTTVVVPTRSHCNVFLWTMCR